MKITKINLYRLVPSKTGKSITGTFEESWIARSRVSSPMSIYPKYAADRDSWLGPAHDGYAIEIETDSGVKGCALNYGGGPFACEIIRKHLSRFLIGESPFNIERIFDQMDRSTSPYFGGLPGMAMSGIDLALWDLLGRILKQPVYNLLGGKVRDEISCYVTTHPDFAKDWLDRNFSGIKIATPYGVESGRDGILKTEEIVANLRESTGNRGDIMLDSYMSWDVEFASRVAERIKKYDVKWFEDPLPNAYEHANNRELRRRITPIGIGVGNVEFHYKAFHQFLIHEACDILQPEIMSCGGLTAVRRIAAMAKPFNIPVIPHCSGIYGYHFSISNVNSPVAEYLVVGNGRDIVPYIEAVNGEPLPVNGKITLSDAPGFGVELNHNFLEPYDG